MLVIFSVRFTYFYLLLLFSLTYNVLCVSSQYRFGSLGDWGSSEFDQHQVAKQLGIFAERYELNSLISCGDNFYEDGVVNDTDIQWNKTYLDVYHAKSLNIPWYIIQGNHDHHFGRGQGEIDYYKNHRDNRWYHPYYWYLVQEHFTSPQGKNITIDIIMIDTVILTVNITSIQSNQEREIAQSLSDQQWQFINNSLESSTSDWLLMVGHFPIYSGGEHGNTKELVEKLNPLLQKYKVDAYIAGHDHNLQHLYSNISDVHYFVSGAGSKLGTVERIPQTLFGRVIPGFMLHSILTNDVMRTDIIDGDGNVLYMYNQRRRIKINPETIFN